MPFDWQALMAALSGRQPGTLGPGGPITGSQQGGQMPAGGGPALLQDQPQLNPNSTTPPPPAGLLDSSGVPAMGLLGMGANILGASGPSRVPMGLGPIVGQGLSGFAQGQMTDRNLALQQQQQDALQRIAQQILPNSGASQSTSQPIGQVPRFMAPTSVPGAPIAAPLLASGAPAFMAPTAVPGPAGVPGAVAGGLPFGGSAQNPYGNGQNPFIRQMLAGRFGMVS